MINLERIASDFKALQDRICIGLEELDGHAKFLEDKWTMATGGGGRTRVISGRHIEKGGVNFSEVRGPVSPALEKILKKTGENFFATGVSIVLHPSNPHVPIIHMNVRYFEMDKDTWWFGGGIDLTPHYVQKEQATRFHQSLKHICDQTSLAYYSKFKTWADDYFFLRHRSETRGVGGIFFDRLTRDQLINKDALFHFVLEVGNGFLPIYREVFQNNFRKTYTELEKEWQLYRRGRYAEFNLVWDRGTRFGLETGGRTESILMSLPPECIWQYDRAIIPGSAEWDTQQLLKKGVDWAGLRSTEENE